MTVSWSAEMDQRLLIAVLAVVKLDNAALEEKWNELFKLDNINQPTARAIKEHIVKLKKTLGIAGGKTSSGNGHSTPAKSKAKATGRPGRKPWTVKIPDIVKTDDDDENEKPVFEVKDERIDSPMQGSTPPPRSKGKPQAKRRRGSMSDEESSDDEVISVKSEDDEFRGPKTNKQTPSPTRSQAPRRAKSGRKVSWVELSSTEEEDNDVPDDEPMDEVNDAADDAKEVKTETSKAAVEEAVPDTQLVVEDEGVMVID